MPQLLYQRNDESGYEAGFWATRLNEGLEFAVRWERGGYRANGSRGEVTILVDNEQVGHSRCNLADPWSLVTGFELAFGRAERGWEDAGHFGKTMATSAPQPVLDYMLRNYGDVLFGGIPRPFGLSEGFWSDCRTQFLAEVCGVYTVDVSRTETGRTPTGRLSTSSPNLQNIPIKSDLGREIAEKFCPRKKYTPATWKPTAADLAEIKECYGKDADDVLAEIVIAGYRVVGWAEPNEENCIRWWINNYGAHAWAPDQSWSTRRLKVVKK